MNPLNNYGDSSLSLEQPQQPQKANKVRFYARYYEVATPQCALDPERVTGTWVLGT